MVWTVSRCVQCTTYCAIDPIYACNIHSHAFEILYYLIRMNVMHVLTLYFCDIFFKSIWLEMMRNLQKALCIAENVFEGFSFRKFDQICNVVQISQFS